MDFWEGLSGELLEFNKLFVNNKKFINDVVNFGRDNFSTKNEPLLVPGSGLE
jgi:hypothetical protein